MKKILTLILSVISLHVFAQEMPIAISGATLHTGTGEVIENSLILIKDGKIEDITTADKMLVQMYRTIDAKGKHVYPGAIAAATQVGLVEIEAVRSTNDWYEVGDFNPHIRALIAYNTDSKFIPTLRFNGVLTVQTAPYGAYISGTSSIFKLSGWNWEDAVVQQDDALWMNWPSSFKYSGWWAESGEMKPNEAYNDDVKKITQFLSEAKAYYNGGKGNLRLDAMKPVLEGKRKMIITCSRVKEMIDAIETALSFGIQPVIYGGEEAYLITDYLKAKNIPVIVGQSHALPYRNDADYDQSFKQAAILTQKGVLCGLSLSGSWQQRNLFFNAGSVAAFGINKEQALALVTSNIAKILGIDAQLGSIQVGKKATLLISEGDILDMKTSILTHIYIEGEEIQLNDMQQQLYLKFREKYIQQGLIKSN